VDENIHITGKANYMGAIDWNCTIIYPSGDGASLKFNINTSTSIINALISSLTEILEVWPTVGQPD
jgi:hypothetical protein